MRLAALIILAFCIALILSFPVWNKMHGDDYYVLLLIFPAGLMAVPHLWDLMALGFRYRLWKLRYKFEILELEKELDT